MANDAGLKAGTSRDFEGSMAQAMEVAFGEEWGRNMGSVLPPTGQNMLRMVFSAIAQGVVRHLFENPGAFRVAITVEQDDVEAEPIESKNSEELRFTPDFTGGVWKIPVGVIRVSQGPDPVHPDPVQSTGEEGTVEEITVLGELYGGGP